jgi:hypothetical protein
VLRLPNGQNVGADLQVVSLSGGLLSLPQPVSQGSSVKLIFLTGSGAVLGGAEMLRPVTDGLQPFRFIDLEADDQRRLGALIEKRSAETDAQQQAWMEKLREASARQQEPRRWGVTLAAAVGLVGIAVAAAAYLLHLRIPLGLLR